jgi:methionyl-tRNA formyltransferase
MKLIFMGTPEFALPSLEKLANAKSHEVSLVVTQPDKPKGRGLNPEMPPVKKLALSRGLNVMQPGKLKGNNEISEAFKHIMPDAVVVVAYGKLIPAELLDIPPYGFINVHASLLPALRGAAPINHAILSGLKRTGISIMKLNEGLDTGPVYERIETDIPEDEDAVSLSKRLSLLGADALASILDRMASGRLNPEPQNDAGATYAHILKKENGLIDWNISAAKINNMVRGLIPWPCAYSFLEGRQLKILKAGTDDSLHGNVPGILLKHGQEIRIACGSGFLIPHILQLEGKKAMAASAFANGLKTDNIVLGRDKR